MCICIVTTAHPQFPFILISNRDEYLCRPTALAAWWDPPHSHILGGRDLHSDERSTWLGITRQGRIACLTNYNREGRSTIQVVKSRGSIVNAYLTTAPDSKESTNQFAQRLAEEDGISGVRGFSLLFGMVRDCVDKEGTSREEQEKEDGKGRKGRKGKGLAIISNQMPDREIIWIASTRGETHALSNTLYGDTSWPKVVYGEESVKSAIQKSVKSEETKEQLIERLFRVLSVDTLPRQKNGEEWDVYLNQLRHSIFMPPVGGHGVEGKTKEVAGAYGQEPIDVKDGVYGTQKQTVILVDTTGRATFVEKTRFDMEGNPVEVGKGDLKFEFEIEGW